MSGGYVYPVIGATRVSSPFGNRTSPGGIGSTNHKGLDIAAPRGSPVVAPIGGTIEVASGLKGYGNAVYLRGDDGNQYRFAHLDGFNTAAGARVGAGQQIGRVGSTGNSTGNHLHFEVRNAAGQILNPEGLLSGAVKQGKSLLDKGKSILKGNAGDLITAAANAYLPGSGAVLGVLGIGGESCGVICQIQNWIKDSGFFSRLAIGVLALIIIAAAVSYFARGELTQSIAPILKGK